MDGDEFHGIGNALKKLAKDLSVIQDILNCGHDSTAITENYFEEEEIEEDKEDEQDNTDQA